MSAPAEPPEEDLSFAEARWVRIMADYAADGVWHRDGSGDSADELPIPVALVARIRAWQAWFEEPSPFEPLRDPEAFQAEGLAIARAVKAALPDWTVIYKCEEVTLPGPGDAVA